MKASSPFLLCYGQTERERYSHTRAEQITVSQHLKDNFTSVNILSRSFVGFNGEIWQLHSKEILEWLSMLSSKQVKYVRKRIKKYTNLKSRCRVGMGACWLCFLCMNFLFFANSSHTTGNILEKHYLLGVHVYFLSIMKSVCVDMCVVSLCNTIFPTKLWFRFEWTGFVIQHENLHLVSFTCFVKNLSFFLCNLPRNSISVFFNLFDFIHCATSQQAQSGWIYCHSSGIVFLFLILNPNII